MIPLNECFLQVAETSLRVSVLIVPILLLRPWLRRWIGSRGLCLLWLVILGRLLIPNCVESKWALNFHWLKPTPPSISVRADSRISMPEKESPSDSASPQIGPIAPRQNFILADFVGILWLFGVAAGAAALGIRQWKTRTLARLASPVSDEQVLQTFRSIPAKIRGSVELLEISLLDTPTVAGVFRPQIWLPSSWIGQLPPGEIRQVLLHELGHVNRHDLLVQWLFEAVRCLHWFNPVVWALNRCCRWDRELACDDWVLSNNREITPAQYGTMLLKTVRMLSVPHRTAPAGVFMAANKRDLAVRIAGIGAFQPRAAWRALVAMAFVVATVGMITTRSTAMEKNAEGRTAPAAPSSVKKASGQTGKTAQEKYVDIVGWFFEIPASELALMTAPSGILENLGPASAPIQIFDSAKADAVLRFINSRRNVDLASTPRVIAKSGEETTAEITREFKYGTDWVRDEKTGVFTPGKFDTKNTGVTLKAKATVAADEETISLHIDAEKVEFLGFLRGGDPESAPLHGNTDPKLPSSPVFSSAKVDTQIEVWSGQTALIWIGENKQWKTENKSQKRTVGVLITASILSDSEAEEVRRKSAGKR